MKRAMVSISDSLEEGVRGQRGHKKAEEFAAVKLRHNLPSDLLLDLGKKSAIIKEQNVNN